MPPVNLVVPRVSLFDVLAVFEILLGVRVVPYCQLEFLSQRIGEAQVQIIAPLQEGASFLGELEPQPSEVDADVLADVEVLEIYSP